MVWVVQDRGPEVLRGADRLTLLTADHADEIVTVLCDAFYDYPVMRFVVGPTQDYDRRLRLLVDLFVAGRVLRGEPLLGVRDSGGTLAGAAIMSRLGGDGGAPASLAVKRELTWGSLGDDARLRYEAYGAAVQPLTPGGYHHHLNMIGVRRSYAGSGLGRRLLQAVQAVAEADPACAGISLSTENPRNVGLYQHFGYRVLGQANVAGMFTTWAMFRPSP